MGIIVVRSVFGLSAVAAGLALLWSETVETQLALTLLIIGGFSIAHLIADLIFTELAE